MTVVKIFLQKNIVGIALGTAILCVLLMAVRSYYSISFHLPLQLMTSGAEYESLYAVWKYINGLTVYANHNRIPFAGSFYNWFYYFFYGEITGAILDVLMLDDAWLPTITRLITIIGAIYGAFISSKIFCSFSGANKNFTNKIGLALAILIFLGPLMGFFGIATQPDIWGFAFDVTAIYLFLRFYEEKPLIGVVLFCVFAYFAWGFKQIFVYSTGSVGLFLLFRRDWGNLFVLTCLSLAGWSATLGLGTAQYIKTIILFGGSTVAFDSAQLLRNLCNFAIKVIPILLGLFGLIMVIIHTGKSKNLFQEVRNSLEKKGYKPHLGLSLLGILFTGIIVIPASSKLGSAENYYFMLSFFLSLFLLSLIFWVEKMVELPGAILWPFGLGWSLQGLAICLVFLGVNGVISKRPTHEFITQVQNCLVKKNLPQPFFISDQYLSLPWVVPAKQHFVIQTNYRWDKPGGVKMEGDGVGGLIDKGYFASVILSGETFDGSDLQQYRNREEKCGSYNIFDRINVNKN